MNALPALATGLVFALANAAHCAGMCGGFALRAASPPRRWAGFLSYGVGKTFTYGFLGALAGSFGAGILQAGSGAQVLIGIAVGCTLLASGIMRMRAPRVRSVGGAAVTGFFQPLLARAGQSDSFGGRFTLGALTAALPCGVVYFAVLQAAATGSRVSAFVLMAAFGLGTLPALGIVALLGGGISRRLSPRAVRFASAGLMTVLGLIALFRAVMPLIAGDSAGSCCH